MANTYTQIHLHFVFAVQGRANLIAPSWKDELYKYIIGIIQNQGHKVLNINGMPDHIHILVGMRPTQGVSDLMKYVKRDSSKWINKKGFVSGKFVWQEGYGAFSYAKSDLAAVIAYIENQEVHHKVKSFKEEYVELLQLFQVEYDERFVFYDV